VHLINPASLGLIGMRHAQALGVPIVASYQTDLPGYLAYYGCDSDLLRNSVWAYLRWLHNQADLNLCPSHFTLAELEAQDFWRLKVWGRGVDSERFSPRYRSAEWRWLVSDGRPESPILLYVGRLAREKRVEWLRPMMDVLPDARLVIVGDGPLRAELEELFSGTSTLFLGFLQGEDLARAYASADLFVFPSASETLGNVVLEAMASGLPVIAPNSGGPVDHVVDGENGFLFEPDQPQEMMALARWLVSNPAHVRRLGASARVYAETQCWEEILDDLLYEYAALVGDRAIANDWPGTMALDNGIRSPGSRLSHIVV
jgi:glycosyltransferase involved in cell wall biosynthesis